MRVWHALVIRRIGGKFLSSSSGLFPFTSIRTLCQDSWE